MPPTFGVVDLFAGPGGLGEGFAAFERDDHRPFDIGISVEKEASAQRTLRLRAFLREYQSKHGTLPAAFLDFHAGLTAEPDWSALDAQSWRRADHEALALELGSDVATTRVDDAIARIQGSYDDTVLIGGPPCQAYSLVGRARSRGKTGYVPEEDERHYLFREYIRALDRLRPAVFVMENVKGMLSSTVESRLVFEMLMEDLSSLGRWRGHQYELRAIRVEDGAAVLKQAARPADFIVRSEEFGVPQRRHRVIIVGIRSDLAAKISSARIEIDSTRRSVRGAIGMLPALRSGISSATDSAETWANQVAGMAKDLADVSGAEREYELREAFLSVEQQVRSRGGDTRRGSRELPQGYGSYTDGLLRWLERQELRAVSQHETRGHMPADLGRYLFAAVFGATRGYSPKAAEFPALLAPNHRNWHSGVFNDRFRAQLAGEPSTTVTSHLSKDGHYFIHPDPNQCRSLTVREAARLQTFPDDYLFLGNRTQQYVQVGNAVPPYLARQIAGLLYSLLN